MGRHPKSPSPIIPGSEGKRSGPTLSTPRAALPASAAKMPYWGRGVKGNQGLLGSVSDGVGRCRAAPTEPEADRAKLLSLQRGRFVEGARGFAEEMADGLQRSRGGGPHVQSSRRCIVHSMSNATDLIRRLEHNVSRALVGKPEVIRLAVVGLLARGHLLIEDVPGVGKTTLAAALARSIGAAFQRIQFTSDMLPSDVIGVSICFFLPRRVTPRTSADEFHSLKNVP